MFSLPKLPYANAALAPVISAETIEYHYGKHHQTYVDNLNKLVPNTEFAPLSLEEIIVKAPAGGIFNNAAQIWNHSFYWNCLKPGGSPIKGELAGAIDKTYGSFEAFQKQFAQAATTLFGSGWTWLVKKMDNGLAIVQTSNAGCPLTAGDKPLLICDVWEHAYYIDYRNARAKYVDSFWKIVNWEFVAKQYAK